MLFVDLDWTPSMNAQAEDRCNRIGQTSNSIQIIRMNANHPMDYHINETLIGKMEVINAVVDRKDEMVIEFSPTIMMLRDETIEEWSERIALIAKEKVSSVVSFEDEDIILTENQKALVYNALHFMNSRTSLDTTKDNKGFNIVDGFIAKDLFYVLKESHRDDIYAYAYHLLKKYRKQLSMASIEI